MPREEEIERFAARSDESKDYTVIVYQEYIMDRQTDAESKGPLRHTTPEEYHLHVIDPDTYKIFETGEILKRVKKS